MASAGTVRTPRSLDDFQTSVGDPHLSIENFTRDFGAYPDTHPLAGEARKWTVSLMHRRALDIPGWLQKITGREPSHLYLSIHDPDGNEVTQIHGLPHDDNGNSNITGGFCNHLRTVFGIRPSMEGAEEIHSWAFSMEQMAARLGNAAVIGAAINALKPDYKPYLPFIQGVNSNTIARNMLIAMNLELPRDVEGRWWNDGKIWAPGFANKDAFRMVRFLEAANPNLFYDENADLGHFPQKKFVRDLERLNPAFVSAQIQKGHETISQYARIQSPSPPVLAA